MNPIGRNQNVSGDRFERLPGTPLTEMRRHLIARLVKSRELVIRDDPLIPEAGTCRLQQDHLQRPPGNRELRPIVPGVQPPILLPDLLTVTVGINQLPGLDADCCKFVLQSQFGKLSDGMRQHIDVDAKRSNFGHSLENGRLNSRLLKAERRRQPANSTADDEHMHGDLPR